VRNIMYIIHEKGEFVYKKNGADATSCPLAIASQIPHARAVAQKSSKQQAILLRMQAFASRRQSPT